MHVSLSDINAEYVLRHTHFAHKFYGILFLSLGDTSQTFSMGDLESRFQGLEGESASSSVLPSLC